ncbi:MAG: non-ribosomal peptide synthetase, partial [Tumebacillaceae bacterium]
MSEKSDFSERLKERKSSLSPSKRELLNRRLRGETTAVPTKTSGIQKRVGEGPATLSFPQQRLWFLDQLDPGNTAYNTPSATRLRGKLHVDLLEQSFNEVVRRHEVLRTTFAMEQEMAVQVIAPNLHISIPVIDLRELPPEQRQQAVKQYVADESKRPFDIHQGPLVRATLLQTDAEEHVLFLIFHHIVSDGWSTMVLIREMTAVYEALLNGKSANLPELPIQYADFAVWQKEWMQGETFEQQMNYWRKQLSGNPTPLQLPVDRPYSNQQMPSGGLYRGNLTNVDLGKLRQLCQQTGVTMFMALLAAFQVLMYRYTGEEDILIGSPIANRQRPELEGLIGFFANTIVLRSSLDGNMSFLQLLAQVRQTTLDAYANQDMPFEKIVEEVQPQRNGMQSPMFNVMFVQDPVMSELRMSGLTFSHIANESSTAKFDITLTVSDAGDEIVGVWEYRTGLFDRTTIERMHRHLEHLVQEIVNHPDRTLSELQLLTEEERHQIVFDWNDTTVEYPQDVCLHQLFEQQVERTPDAVAVVFEEQELTYRELNEQANRLAHYLQKQQVGPEVLVGVCMERSLEMVISLYGILKAGGAFVPIDPSYPSDRLSYLLEDSQIQVLLTQEKWVDTLPNVSSVSIICLDLAEELLAGEPTENLPSATTTEHAAYMIYTSGSTGKPKGVLNTHKGIVNRLLWMKETYELTPDDRVLQKTPFS